MKKTFVLLVVPLVFLAFHSEAETADPLCIKNFAEHQASKANLPELIRSLPMFLIVDPAITTGAIIVRNSSEGQLTLEGRSSRDPHGKMSEPKVIREACFTKGVGTITHVSIILEDNTKKKLKILSDTTAKYSIAPLYLSDQRGYNAVMTKLREEAAGSNNDQLGQN